MQVMHPIIRRKFSIPRLPEPFTERPELTGLLNAGLGPSRSLTRVVAGAGSGKTALLAHHVRRFPGTACWYGLTPADTDPGVFFPHLVACLEARIPVLGTVATGMDPGAAKYATAMGLLADALTLHHPDPLILVLDDCQHLPADPASLDALAALVRFFPEESQLVLAGRTLPDLRPHGGPAPGTILDLDAARLAWDLETTRRHLEGLGQPAEGAEALQARTRGWVAGLVHLAGQRISGAETSPGAEEPTLDDLPWDDVLDGWNEAEQEALVKLAFLPRLDPAWCHELLGPEVEPLLARLARTRPFVQPDESGITLAPVLREGLQARARNRLAPATLRDLYARLGKLPGLKARDRLEHLLEAGGLDDAVALLEAVHAAWLASGREETLASLLGRLAGTVAAESVTWAIMQAMVRRLEGRVREALELLDGVHAACLESGRTDWLARLLAQRAACLGALGDLPGQEAEARAALEVVDVGTDPTTHAFARNVLGLALLARGELTPALASFAEAVSSFERARDVPGTVRVLHNTGLAHARAGAFEQAILGYTDCLRRADGAGLQPLPLTLNNLGLAHLHLGRLDEAGRALEKGLVLAGRVRGERDRGILLRSLGYLRLAERDLPGARTALEEAQAIADRTGDRFAGAMARFGLAEADLEDGLLPRARAWLAQGLATAGLPLEAPVLVDGALLQARLCRLSGQPSEALRWLEHVVAEAARSGNPYLAHHAAGERLAMEPDLRDPAGFEAARQTLLNGHLSHGYPLPAAARPSREVPAVPAGEDLRSWTLEVTTLGSFSVAVEGRPLKDWRTGNARMLLVYLMLHPEGATKERLCELLYGAEAPSRSALPTVVNRLRQALEPDLPKGGTSRFILFEEGRYVLARGLRSRLDVLDLRRHLASAARRDEDPVAHLEAALALYRGPFLDDVDTMPWCDLEREAIRRQLLPVLEAEFERLASRDDWQTLGDLASRVMTAEPHFTPGLRAQAVALAMQERPDEATRLLDAAFAAMATERRLEPDEVDLDLLEAIRERTLTVRQARTALSVG